jgi:hypothetical protein
VAKNSKSKGKSSRSASGERASGAWTSQERTSQERASHESSRDATSGFDLPPLIDLLKAFLEPTSALSTFHALALKQWLAPWIIFMRAYREMLDERAPAPSPEERTRRFLKALMSAYLEFEKSTPTQRSFLAAQRELLDAYLLTAEGLLRNAPPSPR